MTSEKLTMGDIDSNGNRAIIEQVKKNWLVMVIAACGIGGPFASTQIDKRWLSGEALAEQSRQDKMMRMVESIQTDLNTIEKTMATESSLQRVRARVSDLEAFETNAREQNTDIQSSVARLTERIDALIRRLDRLDSQLPSPSSSAPG